MSAELTRTVIYNRALSPTEGKVNLYVRRGAPVVVLIQHGGWQTVDNRDAWMVPWIDALYDLGMTVVGLNWRFAPANKYPLALDDIDLAIRVAHKHIAQLYNRERVPINLVGFSSGAHLAALWALNRPSYAKANFDPKLNVKTVVCLAGPYNLADGSLNEAARSFVGDFLPDPIWQRVASPIIYAPLAATQRTRYVIVHGETDDLVPFDTQAVAMHEALIADGQANVTLRSYPGIGHEIGQYTSPGWSARLAEVVADLRV